MNHKNFLKYSSFLFVSLGIFLLLGPATWFPSFYHPIFFGALFLLSPLFIYLPVIILRKDYLPDDLSLFRIRSRITYALFINNAGELGLYKLNEFGFEYDKFAHFLVSMIFSYTLGEYLIDKKRMTFSKAALLIMLIVFFSGILWEILEALSDMFFHTQEWGDYGKSILSDTQRDILFNILGILAGIFVLRIPKQNRLPNFRRA